MKYATKYATLHFLSLACCIAMLHGATCMAADRADESEPAPPAMGEPYFFYMISCGSYVEHRTSQKSAENQTADTFYVTGWLSAYNRFHTGSDDITQDTDIGSVMLWLEGYCRDNPLSNLEAGLVKVTGDLHARNGAAAVSPGTLPAPASGIGTLSTGPKPAPGN